MEFLKHLPATFCDSLFQKSRTADRAVSQTLLTVSIRQSLLYLLLPLLNELIKTRL